MEALSGRISAGAALLDVGAGVGALTLELLRLGAGTATVVEAAPAYLEAARREAARRGLSDRINFLEGDFARLASSIAPAEIVMMDRVVCCYPEFEPLLKAGLERTQRLFAYSYPQDRWYVRLMVGLENLIRRLRRNPFRTLVHPAAAMAARISNLGFRQAHGCGTMVWRVELWERSPDATARA